VLADTRDSRITLRMNFLMAEIEKDSETLGTNAIISACLIT
jgi:hypothetical protein